MLRCSNLSYSYDGKKSVIQRADFHIQKGEIVGLIGKSGGGKSTLCHMILGLLTPCAGEITLNGKSLFEWKAQRKIHETVQLVMQNAETAFDPNKTMAYSLSELRFFRANPILDEEVEQGLRYLELSSSLLERHPDELSGGQLQRFSILRALLMKPKLLILDEMTSMLDPLVQARIITMLQRLREIYDLTYLMVSHDIALLKQCCDRCLLLQEGEVKDAAPLLEQKRI